MEITIFQIICNICMETGHCKGSAIAPLGLRFALRHFVSRSPFKQQDLREGPQCDSLNSWNARRSRIRVILLDSNLQGASILPKASD
jgi:NurA-like 5'-3' nuclease